MLQVKSQEKPLQLAVALGGKVHAVQELDPHELTEVFATQRFPQR